jgi:hypothetical protein
VLPLTPSTITASPATPPAWCSISRRCRRRNGIAEVIKMRTAYKAPIDPKDVDAILDYLVSIKSLK